ncbi:MAG TPA: hypothetical protein VHN80_25290 [Kineosporiaceae bacterium]|nr:hypothetical protein [Kineosporiaceae bacterium]
MQKGEMSIAELAPAELRMEDLPERAWPREEIIDGSLHVTPLGSAGHQFVVTQLTLALREVLRFGPRLTESCWLSEVDLEIWP